MGEPALQLAPAEEAAAEEAARQTTRFVVIEGGKSAAAGTGEAVAGEAVAGEAVAEGGILAGAGAGLLAVGAALLILFWPSEIAPEPTAGPRPTPGPVPVPNPDPVTQCLPQQRLCDDLIQAIRDAIDRNKRDYGNRGMHGLRRRWQELIDGPCGPGQRPYRINSRGEYVRTPVWENHVDEFNRTKNALRNRFDEAVDASCSIPDDLVDEAADAERMQPPSPDQWRGDPARPCTDSPPPPGWQGPLEPPAMRGL